MALLLIPELNFYQTLQMVVDGQPNKYRNVILGILQGSLHGLLLFTLQTHDM